MHFNVYNAEDLYQGFHPLKVPSPERTGVAKNARMFANYSSSRKRMLCKRLDQGEFTFLLSNY